MWCRFLFRVVWRSGRQFAKVCRDLLYLVYQKSHLNEFDVPEVWIPMYVGVRDNDTRPCFLVLEAAYDSNVILAQNPVEHVVRLFEIRALHGDSAKLD